MRHYSMLSAIAYIVGSYVGDSPFTISKDAGNDSEIGTDRVNCEDVELGTITVGYYQNTDHLYTYDAVTHVPAPEQPQS